ncbi:S-layer homology domain-containing protein, partial [uncultured Nostoc sp.]
MNYYQLMCTRKISWLYLLTAFILLGASPINAKPIAGSTLNNFESAENGNRSVSLTNSNSLESNAIAQVNSVSQLSDVKTTDWAFQSLQSVVERYGCIVGYPDSTYKGNRALSRYEFA